jgi:hypothetical protein
MNPYLKGFIRWGALGAEIFFLFLLVWCIGVCKCPLTPENLWQFAVYAIGALICAFVSSSQSERPKVEGKHKLMQIAFEPPFAMLIIAIVLLIEQVTNHPQSNHAYSVYRIR